MLQQILIQTPVYVWAILAFLIYRGVVASKDRVVSYRSVFIIPTVMLVLGANSIARGFGLDTAAGAAWLGGMVAGAGIAWALTGRVTVDRAAGVVVQRGSWIPLALMMAIFFCKYAVAVTLTILPALRGNAGFAVPVCVAFGVFNGVFLGRLLRTVAAWNAGRSAAQYAV
jgi:hypothetical protein